MARFTIHRLSLSAVVLMAMIVGCAKPNPAATPPPPPEVTVALPQQRDVVEYLQTTGNSHPVLLVEMRARVRGFLKERHVEEGAIVKQDQLLLVIDEEPFQVALDQAKAGLAGAETSLLKAEQSLSREMMRAQLAMDEAQLQLASAEEKRLLSAAAASSGAVSQTEMDRASATRKQAEAKVASTRANLAQVEADFNTNIAAAKADVAAAKTAVRTAEINLGYCRIYSPIAGRIGRVNYDLGNLVGDGSASLLTTIVKYDPIQVYTTLSVDDFLKYREVAGQRSASGSSNQQVVIEMALGNEAGYPHRGEVDYYDPMVDQGTGTIEMRGVFPNPDAVILPGMFARLRIPIGRRPNAILVPDAAIATDQLGQYILVVDADNKVNYRHVETGQLYEGMRVVSGKIGLQEHVIVEGLLRARPGAKVAPKLENSQAELNSTEGAARVSAAN